MSKSSSFWMFLIGLGSATQFHFVGSLGISEFPLFLIAPFIFITDCHELKRDGFMPFLLLTLLTCLGCVISSLVNFTPSIVLIKAFAMPYSIFATTVVMHRLLRKNLRGLKWFIIGVLLSGIISIFIFQPEVYTNKAGYIYSGDEATALVVSNPLFWSSKIKSLIMWPISAFYLSVPTGYSICATFAGVLVSLFGSGISGRSAALSTFLAFMLIVLGKKSRFRIKSMGRHIGIVIFGGILAIFMFKSAYSWAAKSGLMGYEAQEKYRYQTRTGESALKMLMAGRMEFFCGLMACLDHPIVGFGPLQEDKDGYVERYLNRYAALEDYEKYIKWASETAAKGESIRKIPAHSYITCFWINNGILGLILWLYVLYIFYKYFKNYAHGIPQWYGYICLGISGQIWDIFFSPYGGRVSVPTLICAILFCKAVVERKLILPMDMEIEARKYE